MRPSATLPPDVEHWRRIIRERARSEGLDFFEVLFEMVDYDDMHMVAAFDGFPTRYPHWRFGMKYEELQKTYSYGLAKIYELVINNDPCYAYLMRNNPLVDQKLVMAHVYAHSDFFKNNAWFTVTNRKMVDEMANHGTRIRRYIDRYGHDEVETFIDTCLSLENLIDVHAPYFGELRAQSEEQQEKERLEIQGTKFKAKPYMEAFINPPAVLAKEKAQRLEELTKLERTPPRPERDVLGYLLENAPLKRWQKDVLATVREEAYYFTPQRMTKIMNEGWASYWHSKLMTSGILDDSEVIDYADHHSGTLGTQPGVLNPYKVGLELYRDIEERWDKGRFGPEFDECDDYLAKKKWDRGLGIGRNKIFQVRKVHNDITFIDEFLTPEFCDRHKLFTYRFDRQSNQYVIDSRSFKDVKAKLLDSLANFGQPVIRLDDANFKNRGELHLNHEYSGLPLKLSYARVTMENLHKIWGRGIYVETVVDGKRKMLSYNGSRHEERLLN